MPLMSERVGVNNWLIQRGVKNHIKIGELLSDFQKETGESFYRTFYPDKQPKLSNQRFQLFVR